MIPNFFPWRSLKTRVLALTLGIFLLSLWSLSFYASNILRDDMQRVSGAQQFSLASFIAKDVNDALNLRMKALEILASEIDAHLLDQPASLQKNVANRPLTQLYFNAGIFITRLDGLAVAEFPVMGRVGLNYMDKDHIMAALRDGKATIGKPVVGKRVKAASFAMTVPIRDAQGKVIGAIAGATDLSKVNFLDSFAEGKYGESGGLLLIDSQHRLIITATDKSRIMEKTPAPGLMPFLDRLLDGHEGTAIFTNSQGREVLNSGTNIHLNGWRVIVSMPTDEAFAPVQKMQTHMLFVTLLATLLSGVLTWWVLKRQLAPMQQAAKTIALLSHTDQPLQPLPIQTHDEIGELILGFNRQLAIANLRETALQMSEQRFRNLIDHNNAVILQVEPVTGQILDANDSASVFYGWNKAQLCAMNIKDINTLGPSEIKVQMAAATSGKRNYFIFSHRLANGESRAVEVHSTSITSGPKTVLVSIIHDITQRQLADQRIVHLMHEQQAILNSRIIGIVKIKDRKFTWCNAAFEEMMGYVPGELVGQSTRILYPSDQAFDALSQVAYPVLQRGEIYRTEIEYLRKDRSLVWFELSGGLLAQGVEGSIWACIDISDRKRLKARLLSAKADAEAANHAKSRFLAAASHDLRQPLAAMSLYVGILKRQAAPANSDLVARIEDCSNSLSELLTDLLDVSKFDAGVVTPKLSEFAIDDLLGALFTVHQVAAQEKELHLRWRHAGLTVRCDQQLLSRILGNLISNAIRFTHQGGVLIACRRHQGRWWVEVWDTGIGIAADQTGLIFEEFRQLGDDARNRGSGLGLAIAAKAAALLGLEIRLRSRPGRGSMFAVALPLAVVSTPTIAPSAQPLFKPVRIALVEDHPDVLRALQLALESAGHTVVAATNSQSLMNLLGSLAPDIVISDFRLGDGLTGFGVIAQARVNFGEALPALLITGDTDPDVIRRMSEQGITVLFKPMQIDALLTAIGAATAA